jgi:FkbM family methyltransferase
MQTNQSKNYVRYSQNNEQDIILDYFRGKRDGIFLDIGANDGITLSNTYALHQLGWNGVYVEASPKAYNRLIESLPERYGVVKLNYAVGNKNEDVVFYESGELLGKNDTALVSSTFMDEVHRWDSLNLPFEKIVVPMIDFKTMLQKCAHAHNKFDLLSLDIEGGEKDVLPQIDFNELGISMALIEWNGKDAEFYDGIMFNFGFKLVATNPENRIYAK